MSHRLLHPCSRACLPAAEQLLAPMWSASGRDKLPPCSALPCPTLPPLALPCPGLLDCCSSFLLGIDDTTSGLQLAFWAASTDPSATVQPGVSLGHAAGCACHVKWMHHATHASAQLGTLLRRPASSTTSRPLPLPLPAAQCSEIALGCIVSQKQEDSL